jgi:hypothetical protein
LSIPTREIVTPPAASIVSSAARAACALAYSSAQRACSSGASMPRSAETGPHLDARLKRVAVDDAHHLGRIDGLQIELA